MLRVAPLPHHRQIPSVSDLEVGNNNGPPPGRAPGANLLHGQHRRPNRSRTRRRLQVLPRGLPPRPLPRHLPPRARARPWPAKDQPPSHPDRSSKCLVLVRHLSVAWCDPLRRQAHVRQPSPVFLDTDDALRDETETLQRARQPLHPRRLRAPQRARRRPAHPHARARPLARGRGRSRAAVPRPARAHAPRGRPAPAPVHRRRGVAARARRGHGALLTPRCSGCTTSSPSRSQTCASTTGPCAPRASPTSACRAYATPRTSSCRTCRTCSRAAHSGRCGTCASTGARSASGATSTERASASCGRRRARGWRWTSSLRAGTEAGTCGEGSSTGCARSGKTASKAGPGAGNGGGSQTQKTTRRVQSPTIGARMGGPMTTAVRSVTVETQERFQEYDTIILRVRWVAQC
ncbi:hypothetical protein C8T65DRAFT_235750 [Cerioporus squamosus]|nr:hypothetical protein C8T65DRAFT_235750 [Cerioporus squamosus]